MTVSASVATFLLGLLVPRFWMSKKERKDVDQANYQNSERLLDGHQESYRAYVDALRAYQAKDGQTGDAFFAVARAGDDYFRKARFTCDAILSDKITAQHRDGTLVPHFERLCESTISEHYKFLGRESKKHGFDHPHEFKRTDYQSIFDVVEKYGQLEPEPSADPG